MFGLFKKLREGKKDSQEQADQLVSGKTASPKVYSAPKIDSPYGDFTIQPWCEVDVVNGTSFSKQARAKGRYEVAEAFYRVGVAHYGDTMVGNRDPSLRFTEEDLERFETYYRDWLAYTPEFALLVKTRERLIHELAAHPDGIARDKLKTAVGHSGVTQWGVICNQLAKGGFIRQEDKILFPADTSPITNQEFLAQEIPAPGTSGMGFDV